jgi:hypothetical protein
LTYAYTLALADVRAAAQVDLPDGCLNDASGLFSGSDRCDDLI